jgi:hypothetical protein
VGRGGPATPARLIPGLDSDKRQVGAARRDERDRRAEEMEDVLYHLALLAEREETRIAAAARLHAIYCGQPVARQVNANASVATDVTRMTDEELEAVIRSGSHGIIQGAARTERNDDESALIETGDPHG